jgi:exopolyphosphatase/guanosine-5'-triphosphate,3'-diphosphate pyrophosphatase
MKIAVIDLGSNSFHMVLYDVDHCTRRFSVIDRAAQVNALGRYVSLSGSLPWNEISESAELVARLAQRAEKKGAQKVYAFGTGIFRKLTNSMTLKDEIFKRSGICVDIVSEKKEVTMIYTAIQATLKENARSFVLDIGGGSSECIVASQKKIYWSHTVPYGTAVLLERFSQEKTHSESKRSRIIREIYREPLKLLKRETIAEAYSTAGFLRYLAEWFKKENACNAPVIFTRHEIDAVGRTLSLSSFSKGSERERHLVRIGTAVLRVIMHDCRLPSIVVSDASSREGYLLLKCREEHGF